MAPVHAGCTSGLFESTPVFSVVGVKAVSVGKSKVWGRGLAALNEAVGPFSLMFLL